MNLLDLVRAPLFRAVLMVLWLLPCAIQDRRTRRVSNWLTVPLFLLAWPVAILTDHLALTLAVFIGVYVATKLEPRAGAADGKLMVGLAAFAPLALGQGVLLEARAALRHLVNWRVFRLTVLPWSAILGAEAQDDYHSGSAFGRPRRAGAARSGSPP